MGIRFSSVAAAALLTVAAAVPALAQKSEDTARIAFLDPIAAVDLYLDPKPEIEFLAAGVFDGLVIYDEKKGEYQGLLAESWEQTSPTILKFKLREGVTWHDGEQFDADDVVYTINWLIDPETKFRFKAEFDWIKAVRKTGPYEVELESKEPYPAALMVLSYQTPILPQHVHEPLEDKLVFGRKPVGTGMYKVLSFDPNAGVVLEKNPDYDFGGEAKPASNVGKVEIRTIPDAGTQTAELLAGNIDIIRNVPFEQGKAIADADPRFEMTITASSGYYYISLDALGRSSNKALSDERVRRAIMMAIDREALKRVRTGDTPFEQNPGALCWDWQAGCAHNVPQQSYDPEGARKLLAEAGYPNGFPVTISTFNSLREYAEFVSGQLREVGIEASVSALTFAAYRKAQTEGDLEILLAGWNAGIGPDTGRSIAYFFTPSSRDYYGDKEIHAWAAASVNEPDPEKRKALVAQVLDRATEKSFVSALGGIPVPFLHSSDLVLDTGSYQPFALSISGINWK